MGTSKAEEIVAKLLARHGIEHDRERGLWSHHTKRYRSPDFYLPAANLYVEVKGVLTFDAIRKIDELARGGGNYYLYSASDFNWQAYASDWPEIALPKAAADRLNRYQRRVSTHWSRRSRDTKAYRYKKHDLEANVALQSKELLRLARDPEMAKHASAVTRKRLKRYVHMMADEFFIVGLLADWKSW